MTALTVEQFKQALPEKVKKSVNQELIDLVNQTLSDPEMYEQYRENLVSYTSVMADGKFQVKQYIHAVKYVSHKLLGASNIEAYSKTFPDKIMQFSQQKVANKDIASYISAYNKSKLVNLIMAQTMVPSYILNQDVYQEAINTQADLMRNAKSEKVRTDAANSLLVHLKMPEVAKVELDVTMKEDGSIAALRATTMELARQQQLAIASGSVNAQQIAHSKVHAEVVDVDAKEVSE
jgi:hypothetical protein